MPCRTCVHFVESESGEGSLCRLKSDSVGLPFPTRAADLCEFFDLDPGTIDEQQMVVCRHCGAVAFIGGELELCSTCEGTYNLPHFFREEGRAVAAIVRFNCSRPYRERWLKQRLEVKQGGKSL